MANGTLVETDIVDAGRTVLKVLKDAKIQVLAAVWAYDTLLRRYELTLVLPLVDEIGVHKSFKKIEPLLSGHLEGITMSQLELLTPQAQYAISLRIALKGLKESQLRDYPIQDGAIIEDGYVYFVK